MEKTRTFSSVLENGHLEYQWDGSLTLKLTEQKMG
jgi:hypothetical protein